MEFVRHWMRGVSYSISKSLAFGIRCKLRGLATGGGGACGPDGFCKNVSLELYMILSTASVCIPFVIDIGGCTAEVGEGKVSGNGGEKLRLKLPTLFTDVGAGQGHA